MGPYREMAPCDVVRPSDEHAPYDSVTLVWHHEPCGCMECANDALLHAQWETASLAASNWSVD